MRLGAVLRSFRSAPWPALFIVAGFGFVLSAQRAVGVSLDDICTSRSLLVSSGTEAWMGQALESWAVMLVAMMPPLLAMPLAHVWRASLPRRRLRTVLMFLTGYGALWLAAGPVHIALAALLQWAISGNALPLAVLVALIWSASPWQRGALNRSHRLRRIGLFGWGADRDGLVFGMTHGCWCVLSCWAWMTVPLLAGAWHLPAMLLVGGIMLAERLAPGRRPEWRWPVFLGRLAHG